MIVQLEQQPLGRGTVYCATNSVNGKSYVGMTMRDIDSRRRDHVKNALAGADTPFYRAIRKYGHAAFAWRVLQECSTPAETLIAEKYWIMTLGTFVALGAGYNATLGGDGVFGYTHTAEANERNRRAHVGRGHTSEVRQKLSTSMSTSDNVKRKSVEQIDLKTGDVVMRHESLCAAAVALNNPTSVTLISRCCRGRVKSALGWSWRYVSAKDAQFVICHRQHSIRRPVEQHALNGDLVAVHESMAAAQRSTGYVSRSAVRNCCHGKLQTAYGYRWTFENDTHHIRGA